MYIKTILLGCLSMALVTLLPAQDKSDLHVCGTQDGKVEWLARYQADGGTFERSGATLFLPIKVHLVGTSQGEGHFPVSRLLDAFCTLNNDFVQADIQFFISGDINYINNDNYYDHTFQQGNQMMSQNNVSAKINCYVVDSPAGNCGYSNYFRGIALAKSCMGAADHTWAHEVGHYLSLPHPFFGWEGTDSDFAYNEAAPNFVGGEAVERMDGSNCQFAADGFCDTPPDYLAYRWPCSSDNLSNQTQTDPDGVTFRSDGSLIMSYALDNCSSRFSEEQIDAMHANVNQERANLIGQMDELLPPAEVVLNPISPAEGSTVDFYEEVFFEWEPIAEATGYIVDVSRFQNFNLVEHRYEVEGSSFVSTDFKADRTYYWRLRPYNAQYTCDNLTETSSFFTGMLSDVKDIEEVNGMQLMPNPLTNGNNLQLDLQMTEPVDLQVRMISVTGQTVEQFDWETNVGQNRWVLNTQDLQAGIYFLQLQSANGVMSRKVVVQ
ncbi:MAG: zinc-dependent metalloprotease [Bacteroidota bacterium]